MRRRAPEPFASPGSSRCPPPGWRSLHFSAVECGREKVLGPMLEDDEVLVWTSQGLEIAEAGDYVVDVKGKVAGTAGVRFTRCASCWDSVDFLVKAGQTRAVTLAPGKYDATFIKTLSEVGELDVSLAHMP